MARVTVEDCITKVPNRFKLVLLSAQRARNVSAGAAITVDRDNDKNPVVALREIADETIEMDELEDGLIKSLQRCVEADEPEEEELDMMAIQQDTGVMAEADNRIAPYVGMSPAIQFEDDAAALGDAGNVFSPNS